MRDIIIEVGKCGCVLLDAKNGGYIHAYTKLVTAEKKAKEIANGGKVAIKYMNQGGRENG